MPSWGSRFGGLAEDVHLRCQGQRHEVMKKAADHAKTAHGMATIPPDVETKARAVIRDA
jgi:predicted small metal-binding protein